MTRRVDSPVQLSFVSLVPGLRVGERAEVDHRLVAGRAAESARTALSRPAPTAYGSDAGERVGGADERGLEPLTVQSGCRWASSAAAPATCGLAIEVPD